MPLTAFSQIFLFHSGLVTSQVKPTAFQPLSLISNSSPGQANLKQSEHSVIVLLLPSSPHGPSLVLKGLTRGRRAPSTVSHSSSSSHHLSSPSGVGNGGREILKKKLKKKLTRREIVVLCWVWTLTQHSGRRPNSGSLGANV